MGDNEMTTEAQKRASKKYYLKNKDYYFEKSRENSKKVRLERNEYKARIDKAIEYINHAQNYGTMAQVMPHLKPYVNGKDLLSILQGDSNDN